VAGVEILIIITAWFASGLNWGIDNPGRIIVYAVHDHLPVALGSVIIATIIAIIVSTADSYLLVPSTAIVRDIYQRFIDPDASPKRLILMSRITVVALGIIAYILSTLDDRFLAVALYAYTIYGAGITPALLAAFFWKRATTAGGISSILAGTLVTVIWKNWDLGSSVPQALGLAEGTQIDAVIPAIILSVLTLIVVSLATKRPPDDKWRPFYRTQ
jgi:SSS family solute:Na+ symporter/sodium/proline symporter